MTRTKSNSIRDAIALMDSINGEATAEFSANGENHEEAREAICAAWGLDKAEFYGVAEEFAQNPVWTYLLANAGVVEAFTAMFTAAFTAGLAYERQERQEGNKEGD